MTGNFSYNNVKCSKCGHDQNSANASKCEICGNPLKKASLLPFVGIGLAALLAVGASCFAFKDKLITKSAPESAANPLNATNTTVPTTPQSALITTPTVQGIQPATDTQNQSTSKPITTPTVQGIQPATDTQNQSTSKLTDLSSISIDSPKSVDYKPLRQALEEHDWRIANDLTTEALLKAFGNESYKKGGVQQQETKAPPCEDIKIVDRLWSKASNGNLGFTAQRQVMKPFGNNWEQAYKQLRWLSPDQEWKIKYLYNGERYNFKIGYSPDFKEPITKGYLPTFERGYNFAYSLDGTLYMCNIN